MCTALDVASYVLEKKGPLTAMQLEKIVYYCQAWSLVWDNVPLFEDRIEAWMNGPVIPTLFEQHKGRFKIGISDINGNFNNLSDVQRETIDEVMKFYADKSGQWLSDLTHREKPWIEARQGLALDQRGNNEITQSAMHEYYSSIQ